MDVSEQQADVLAVLEELIDQDALVAKRARQDDAALEESAELVRQHVERDFGFHRVAFESPAGFAPEQGFYDGASARVADMLLFRDVSTAASEQSAASLTDPLSSSGADA